MDIISDEMLINAHLHYIRAIYEQNSSLRQSIAEKIKELAKDFDVALSKNDKDNYSQHIKDWLLDNLGENYETLLCRLNSKLLDQLCNKEKYILIYTLIKADLEKDHFTICIHEKGKKANKFIISKSFIPWIIIGKPYICIADYDTNITYCDLQHILFTAYSIDIKEENINEYRQN